MIHLNKFIDTRSYFCRRGMFQDFNPKIWANFNAHEHLKLTSGTSHIIIRNAKRNYRTMLSSVIQNECKASADFYCAPSRDSFLICRMTDTVYIRFNGKTAARIPLTRDDAQQIILKYYRMFYASKNPTERKKRINTTTWPVYKLPITIQNPYL